MRNPEITRKIVAGILWFFLILCILAMFRCNILMSATKKYLAKATLRPEDMVQEMLVSQTAASYAREWATFTGITGQTNYSDRLKTFNVAVPSNRGVQKCESAAPLSVEKTGDNTFRVKVLLRISRLTNIPQKDAYNIEKSEIVEKVDDNDTQVVKYWNSFLQTVEVSVKDDDGISMVGYPVIIPNEEIKETDVSDLYDSNQAPEEFQVFARQMLEMFYEGKDLTNYSDKDANIRPIDSSYGFKLSSMEIMGYNKDGDKGTALVNVKVSGPSLDALDQLIVLEGRKEGDHWILTRLGAN